MQFHEHVLLKPGDVVDLTKDHRVYAMVPCHFVYSNRKGDFSMTKTDVQLDGTFEYLTGRYMVYKTLLEGGGQGMHPGDVYPDGHHVYCKKLDDPRVEVDFFQTGCFTALIPNIRAVCLEDL